MVSSVERVAEGEDHLADPDLPVASTRAATSSMVPPTVSPRSVPSEPATPSSPCSLAVSAQAARAAAGVVADHAVDRHGPLDVVERAADLVAPLPQDLAHLGDPLGRP